MTTNTPAPKTQEFVVTMEPEYGATDANRRTITVQAEDCREAALAAVRAFTSKNPKTLSATNRFHRDPATVHRYVTRRDGEGDRYMLIVDLSPAEVVRIAAAEAAKAAARQALEDAAKPDEAAYNALATANPDVWVSLSNGYVRAEWKIMFGDEGTPGHDYCRIEVTKNRGYRDDHAAWDKPAEVSVGNVTLKRPGEAARLALGIVAAAAVATMFDVTYPAGSPDNTIPEDANPVAASYRAHTAMLARVVETIATAALAENIGY